ncbi:MAG TPA: hypothetical protein PKD86_16615 [Gemmatales bacterium]|nr:hypothetical protein [Gemmatales bacterium]HMP60968.1 hypothetical protein [Gemmatales bacterium]
MSRCFVLIVLLLCVAAAGCTTKPPSTATMPSPYTYSTVGMPPEPEEDR